MKKNQKSTLPESVVTPEKPRKNSREDFIIRPNSNFAIVESYKTIRTNLKFSLNKEGCRKIVITSALPRDGKSMVTVNLAVSLAQTNERVLIIDGDLRKARVHKFFGIKNIPGLTNLLGGFSELSEVIKPTDFKNLFIIPCGVVPPNPAELLASESMKNLISQLEKEFDYILIDSPPVNIVSDALTLTPIVDGVIVVTKQKVNTHPEMQRMINSLEFVGARIIGIILNGVDLRESRNYYKGYYKGKYGYKYKYNYSYGNNYSEK